MSAASEILRISNNGAISPNANRYVLDGKRVLTYWTNFGTSRKNVFGETETPNETFSALRINETKNPKLEKTHRPIGITFMAETEEQAKQFAMELKEQGYPDQGSEDAVALVAAHIVYATFHKGGDIKL